jgi:glycosyltransferase involved in cell wall biosynthesis
MNFFVGINYSLVVIELKVLQVCPRFSPFIGGIATHVKELAKNLVTLGVEVEVYTTDPEGRLPKKEIRDAVSVNRFRSYSFGDLYFFSPGLYRALKKLKSADVVHVHNYQDFCALAAVCAKRNNQKPLIFTPHFHPVGANELRTMGKKLYASLVGRRIFENSDAVIAVSNYEKHLLPETFQLSEQRIMYVPNGINVENCKHAIRINNSPKKNILYVGRLEEYKGVQYLISAFPKVRGKEKDAQLLIVGVGSQKKKLVSLAESLGVRNDVHFLGNVSDVELADLYSASSLFVMPSEYEAFCIAVAEAMAFGLPIIATRVGGMPELIGDNSRGLLINYPPDVKTLAEMELRLLNDSNFSSKIGHAARDYALAEFSWRSVAENLVKVYTSLCGCEPETSLEN